MWWYELHPSHVINIATLPRESRNSKNVLSQYGILPKRIASNVSYMLHRNGNVDYKIWGVLQQCVYGTKIYDIYDLQNAWRKLGLTLNRTLSRLRLTSGATVWDNVRVLVADTLNTCCSLHFAWVVDDAKCIVVTRVCVSLCLSVCLSVCGRTPTVLHGHGCNLAAW